MLRCKRCNTVTDREVCWECANPQEFFDLYYRKDNTSIIVGLPPPGELYQPIDNCNVKFHRSETERRLKILLDNVDFMDKTYLDIGCANGYFPLHILGTKRSIGIDVSFDDIVLARKTKEFMKLNGNINFYHIAVDDENIKTAMQGIDIVTVFSVYHHWIRSYGVDRTKEIMRYIFSAKEVILEQGYIPYEVFCQWTGINDFYRHEYAMANPLVMNLMVKACIGFVPEYNILGATKYRQSDGKEYDRVIIHYKMDKGLNTMRVHDDKQVNILMKHEDKVYKYIPQPYKRVIDAQCNRLLGRDMQVHGEVFSIPYIEAKEPNKETIYDLALSAIERAFACGIVVNEVKDDIIFDGKEAHLLDFETATVNNDYADFALRVSEKDNAAILSQFRSYYFQNKAKRFIGTPGMVSVWREYFAYLKENDIMEFFDSVKRRCKYNTSSVKSATNSIFKEEPVKKESNGIPMPKCKKCGADTELIALNKGNAKIKCTKCGEQFDAQMFEQIEM